MKGISICVLVKDEETTILSSIIAESMFSGSFSSGKG